MIHRAPLLSHKPTNGAFRHDDLFQLLPPEPGDPAPPFEIGHYGLTVEIQMDERPCPDRESGADFWAHDFRERRRFDELARKVPNADSGWWDAEKLSREMSRRHAITREVVVLISTLTKYDLESPKQERTWVLDTDAEMEPRYLQQWYPTFVNGPADTLTNYSGGWIKTVPEAEYWESRLYGEELAFPDDLSGLINVYFGVDDKRRVAFARACELAWVARDIWLTSQSMSLAAAVFAVETLVGTQDQPKERCTECGNLKHTSNRRFREFVEQYVESDEWTDRFARDLYDVRSGVVHQGLLLRSDEFDSGFSAGGKDSQDKFREVAFDFSRTVLRGWLKAQSKPSSS